MSLEKIYNYQLVRMFEKVAPDTHLFYQLLKPPSKRLDRQPTIVSARLNCSNGGQESGEVLRSESKAELASYSPFSPYVYAIKQEIDPSPRFIVRPVSRKVGSRDQWISTPLAGVRQ